MQSLELLQCFYASSCMLNGSSIVIYAIKSTFVSVLLIILKRGDVYTFSMFDKNQIFPMIT